MDADTRGSNWEKNNRRAKQWLSDRTVSEALEKMVRILPNQRPSASICGSFHLFLASSFPGLVALGLTKILRKTSTKKSDPNPQNLSAFLRALPASAFR
jgi:hypothetical protein